jgi:hypothetical protein
MAAVLAATGLDITAATVVLAAGLAGLVAVERPPTGGPTAITVVLAEAAAAAERALPEALGLLE